MPAVGVIRQRVFLCSDGSVRRVTEHDITIDRNIQETEPYGKYSEPGSHPAPEGPGQADLAVLKRKQGFLHYRIASAKSSDAFILVTIVECHEQFCISAEQKFRSGDCNKVVLVCICFLFRHLCNMIDVYVESFLCNCAYKFTLICRCWLSMLGLIWHADIPLSKLKAVEMSYRCTCSTINTKLIRYEKIFQ